MATQSHTHPPAPQQVGSLLEPSPALDAALAGAQYVFHVASPFRFDGDPQKGAGTHGTGCVRLGV